ncbi:MAG: hypothetical protein CL678_02290 [Bdellovibrionaceae bacterium]|nr:hypothetical protein [Pseudobdellovibrionaceae bacterium]|tara:strand:- start:428 stop:655 length:228 start_codon:yes stop_codon:yes gene_type:complete
MNNEITIKGRVYQIEKSEQRANVHGQVITYTDLKGSRGADLTLIESEAGARLIHFGRMKPAEMLSRSDIVRGLSA